MSNKTNAILQDSGTERAVLAGIITHGAECFFEVEDIIESNDFYWTYNQQLFKILSYLVQKENAKTFDIASIHTVAKILGYKDFQPGERYSEYLDSVVEEIGPSKENILLMVVNIYKLSIARKGYLASKKIQKSLTTVTGSESVDTIIEQIEAPIFDFTSDITSQGGNLVSLGDKFDNTIEALSSNPQDIIGIPTGFCKWDQCIGGGFRPATVNVVGARQKAGKCIDSQHTAIITSDGILMPYEIFNINGDSRKTHPIQCKLLNGDGNVKQPQYGWINGLSNNIKISTKYGTELIGTRNHPVRILDKDGIIKWKNMDELQTGEYVVTRRGDNCWGKNHINTNDAYVIGLLIGDGCINDKIVCLSSIDVFCRERFRDFILRRGGSIGTETQREVRCCKVTTAETVNQLGFYDENRKKIVPRIIREGDKDTICSMLRGYFDADGCVEKSGITATTNSYTLSIQIRTILLNLGILNNIRKRYIIPPGHNAEKCYWEISIQNVKDAKLFNNIIGFGLERKQKLLDKFCARKSSTKNDTIPNLSRKLQNFKNMVIKNRGFFVSGRRSKIRDYVNRWIREPHRSARRDILRQILDHFVEYRMTNEYLSIQDLLSKNLFFDTIVDINECESHTCDFYIPDGHTFISNGIVSHNSFFCLNVAKNIASNNLPVLYLDTELTYETQLHRLISLVSGIELNKIETGKFSTDKYENEAVLSCKEQIQKIPIDHFSVAGMSPQAIISIARRWLSKRVGFTSDGSAKPCLIIYDYLKLMDDTGFKHNLQEYQLLGFLITSLHNFAVQFKLPVLATVQLNRDGVEKEGTEVISGSDRIGWLCSNFSILKKKSDTDLSDDPPHNGTKKLLVTDTRYGAGMEKGEYINIRDNLERATFVEGEYFSSVVNPSFVNEPKES